MGEFEEPRLDDLVMPISDLDKMKAHLSEKVRAYGPQWESL